MNSNDNLQQDVAEACAELRDDGNRYFKQHGKFYHKYCQKSYSDWWSSLEDGTFNEDKIYEDE